MCEGVWSVSNKNETVILFYCYFLFVCLLVVVGP